MVQNEIYYEDISSQIDGNRKCFNIKNNSEILFIFHNGFLVERKFYCIDNNLNFLSDYGEILIGDSIILIVKHTQKFNWINLIECIIGFSLSILAWEALRFSYLL